MTHPKSGCDPLVSPKPKLWVWETLHYAFLLALSCPFLPFSPPLHPSATPHSYLAEPAKPQKRELQLFLVQPLPCLPLWDGGARSSKLLESLLLTPKQAQEAMGNSLPLSYSSIFSKRA